MFSLLWLSVLLLSPLEPPECSQQAIERRLRELVSAPGYRESFYRRVDAEFLRLSRPDTADEASASERVQAALAGYADRTIHLRFIDDIRVSTQAMVAKVYGSQIAVNVAWLRKSTEEELHAVLAHEIGHDSDDCIRFWLIQEACSQESRREQLRDDIEMRADRCAVALLLGRDRNPAILTDLLKRYLPPGPASRARISAIEERIAGVVRPREECCRAPLP